MFREVLRHDCKHFFNSQIYSLVFLREVYSIPFLVIRADVEEYNIDSEVFQIEKKVLSIEDLVTLKVYLKTRREAVGKKSKEELEERPTGLLKQK